MAYFILLRAHIKKHADVFVSVALLTCIISLSLATVLGAWHNSRQYVRQEMRRAGFGDMTAWISDGSYTEDLQRHVMSLDAVADVAVQDIIYASYIVHEKESDSEGQLISYNPGENRYRFFDRNAKTYAESPAAIYNGEVYVSPSLVSMFGAGIGDRVVFQLARNSVSKVFTIKGFYEDPFMGSSMIGMKGFLINRQDYDSCAEIIQQDTFNALARTGAMLHITAAPGFAATTSELNSTINTQTDINRHTEFTYSFDAVAGFMLILHNAFCGMLAGFAAVLVFVTLTVIGHNISSTIDSDFADMGILKTVGYTGFDLRLVQVLFYAAAMLPGMIPAFVCTAPLIRMINAAVVTSTGMLIPSGGTLPVCAAAVLPVCMLFAAFVAVKTRRIAALSPVRAISGNKENADLPAAELRAPFNRHAVHVPVSLGKANLNLRLALRQILSAKKKYISALAVAMLLALFASLVGRMQQWLGPDGRGMMAAFNPADHDLGVQPVGGVPMDDVEAVIGEHSGVYGIYELAMLNVAVNGVDCEVNAITSPELFHIIKGRTCGRENEIVITEIIAADMGVDIGGMLTVTGGKRTQTFTVSGIYQCANNMGRNIGMSRDGCRALGFDDPRSWCRHYFLTDASQKSAVIQHLDEAFGHSVHVHENTWPGLSGIISAMNALAVFMYALVFVFILAVTVMTGNRLLEHEQKDLGIYKAIGFSEKKLRISFTLRFTVIAAAGSIMGIILAAFVTDPLVSSIMKRAGISNFASEFSAAGALVPFMAVAGIFTVSAYAVSAKIKNTDMSALIAGR